MGFFSSRLCLTSRGDDSEGQTFLLFRFSYEPNVIMTRDVSIAAPAICLPSTLPSTKTFLLLFSIACLDPAKSCIRYQLNAGGDEGKKEKTSREMLFNISPKLVNVLECNSLVACLYAHLFRLTSSLFLQRRRIDGDLITRNSTANIEQY